MNLFILNDCGVPGSLNYLNSKIVSERRLSISEFSGYHSMNYSPIEKVIVPNCPSSLS